MVSERLRERFQALDTRPGVYIFKDATGKVIYVGKALSVRERVRSYHASVSSHSDKTQKLVARIADFEVFYTNTEQEALVLENNFIKKYRPRYNVRLKDDKSYPYLKITIGETWPRVFSTRRLENDGGRYFGPFTSALSVKMTLQLLQRLFLFRRCNEPDVEKRKRACLDYHINRCLGPCVGAVTREQYRRIIDQIILFMEGKQELIVKELRTEMKEAAEKLDFEKAACLRDNIDAVEHVTDSQKLISLVRPEEDVIAFARAGDEAYFETFYVRNGKIVGREHFIVEGARDEEDTDLMTNFITQFYQIAPNVPSVVLLRVGINDRKVIEGWLREKKGAPVRILLPKRGEDLNLVEVAAVNAQRGMEQLRIAKSSESIQAALDQLKEELGLPEPPKRIECYDISNIQGKSAAGSMVVFEDGLPKKSDYRRFRIKGLDSPDDYAMIREVLGRRLGRAAATESAGDAWRVKPSLMVIDGGKGQLAMALAALQAAKADLPVIALAKEREEVFLPGRSEPLVLPANSPALHMLQRIRDEAHRFALGYFHKVHGKATLRSALDNISGIGARRKQQLLSKFGSAAGIREATIEQLASVPGITRSLAVRIKECL